MTETPASSVEHPHLHVTATPHPELLSVEELRRQVAVPGPRRDCWLELRQAVVQRATEPPYTPATDLPGRSADTIRRRENDYPLSEATLERIMSAALAHLIDGSATFLEDALRQLACLFDTGQWPEWRHPVNAAHGYSADHRIGSHLRYLAITYDWLYAALRADQRAWLRDGIVERALQPVQRSRSRDPFWQRHNNWTGIIMAGMGTAAMALGPETAAAADHDELLQTATTYMLGYLRELGPDGDFNESPFYAASMLMPIRYLEALRYHRGATAGVGPRPEQRAPVQALPAQASAALARFGRWYAYHVVLPDRVVPFGDCGDHARPNALQLGLIGAQTDDPVLRWFYQQLRPVTGYANPSFELLALEAPAAPAGTAEQNNAQADAIAPPQGRWPLGAAFRGYGQHLLSRSDWSPTGAACLVAAKAAHGWEPMRARGDSASYHLDYDAGQVIIFGGGEPLVVDLGSSGGYSDGERGRYYGKGTAGHNVLMVDGANTRELAAPPTQVEHVELDDMRGAWWRVNLTGLYTGARSIRRTLVHLLPGVIAVLDEVRMAATHELSLRWHTNAPCTVGDDGCFVARANRTAAVAVVSDGTGPIALTPGRHRYQAPYNVDYYGTPFADGHPYLEAKRHADHTTLLSLFAVAPTGGESGDATAALPRWITDGSSWRISTSAGDVAVTLDTAALQVQYADGGRGWSIPRAAEHSGAPA